MTRKLGQSVNYIHVFGHPDRGGDGSYQIVENPPCLLEDADNYDVCIVDFKDVNWKYDAFAEDLMCLCYNHKVVWAKTLKKTCLCCGQVINRTKSLLWSSDKA